MNYYLGIELKGGQIKIAAFKKNRKSFELVKLDTLDLSIESGEASKELANWVNRNLPEPGSIRAVMTISESSLYLKELQFPAMSDEKLNEAIYWEIPTVAPIPQAEAVFDWQILTREKGMLNTLIVVGKNSYIQTIISAFRKAQIDIVAVEPSSYAFTRIANAIFEVNTLVCLAEERGTDYILLKKGKPFFSTSTTGHSQSEKIRSIKTGLDLTNEISNEGKKIMSYWESKENFKIHQVVLAGDLVYKFINLSHINLFPPIPSYVGTIRKPKSIRFGNYKDLDLNSYLICIGAAVRQMKKNAEADINLTTPEERKITKEIQSQKKLTSKIMTFVVVNIFIIAILIFTIFFFNLWWLSIEKKSMALDQSFANRSVSTLIKDINSTNTTIENASHLLNNQVDSGERLKKISDLTPQTVRLTQISLVKTKLQEWTIEGIGDRSSILAYYEKLAHDEKITEATMPYSNFNNNEESIFSIVIKW